MRRILGQPAARGVRHFNLGQYPAGHLEELRGARLGANEPRQGGS